VHGPLITTDPEIFVVKSPLGDVADTWTIGYDVANSDNGKFPESHSVALTPESAVNRTRVVKDLICCVILINYSIKSRGYSIKSVINAIH
jgi:hypothetical protein